MSLLGTVCSCKYLRNQLMLEKADAPKPEPDLRPTNTTALVGQLCSFKHL